MAKYENDEISFVTSQGFNKTLRFLCIFSIFFFISCGESTIENKKAENECPKGHTDSIIPIRYGMPDETSFEAADRGEIYLGGCDVSDDSPKWFCKIHEITF